MEDKQEGGNPKQFPEGCRDSLALWDLSQKDEEHCQRTFPEIAQELGITAARSTLEKVFHTQNQIFRRRPACKPSFSLEQMEARLAFAHMALQIAINTIVFTDEMSVEFGKPWQQRNVSRYHGADRNTYAIHNKDKEHQPIHLMFWGAIIQGFKGPCHVWEEDTVEDKRTFQDIVDKEN